MQIVYNIDQNGIYTHESIADNNPLEPDKILLMLNQVEEKPLPPKAGYAVYRNQELKKWEYVEDHLGVIVFDPITGYEITIQHYGPISHYATSPKPSRLHEWKNGEWIVSNENQAILDQEEEEEKERLAKQEVLKLRQKVDYDILPLQDAVDLDDATPEEEALLKKLKRFRIALNRWTYPNPIPEL